MDTDVTYGIPKEKIAQKKKTSFMAESLRRLLKEKKLGSVGAIITLLLLLTGIFANFLAPYGMNETHMAEKLQPPSAKYLLGTDHLGRDLLSRIIYGARTSVIVGLAASILATIISLLIGTVSGYMGGKVDMVVQRTVDVVMSFPSLILLMVLMILLGQGMLQVIIVLAIRWGIAGSRIIRGSVIGIKENVYADAAEAIGCSTARIIMRHIIPNIMAPTIILFTTRVPNVILVEASLSFLGFGIPPPMPSWGRMLSGAGRTYMHLAPWMAIWPGLALAIVVYGINMFGDAVRDILDPRLRGGVGRYGVRADREGIKLEDAAIEKLQRDEGNGKGRQSKTPTMMKT
jgi:peptide/nickel transport system permease protein